MDKIVNLLTEIKDSIEDINIRLEKIERHILPKECPVCKKTFDSLQKCQNCSVGICKDCSESSSCLTLQDYINQHNHVGIYCNSFSQDYCCACCN